MARNGKIAHLPFEIRQELNRRLLDTEPGGSLLAWLGQLSKPPMTAASADVESNPVKASQTESDPIQPNPTK
jgi:hypothetical protein